MSFYCEAERVSVAAQRQGEPEQIDMILIFPLVPTLVPTPPGGEYQNKTFSHCSTLHPAGWLLTVVMSVKRGIRVLFNYKPSGFLSF